MTTPFAPVDGTTVSLGATTTTSRVALVGRPAGGKFQLRLCNEGPSAASLKFGDSAVVAVTTNYRLPSGAIEVITLDAALVSHVAAITASRTAAVTFTTGDGI